MVLERVQSHLRFILEAIANQLKSLRGKLLAIDVFAPREYSISNILIPLSTATSFSKNKLLVLYFRLNEPQCIYEVNF